MRGREGLPLPVYTYIGGECAVKMPKTKCPLILMKLGDLDGISFTEMHLNFHVRILFRTHFLKIGKIKIPNSFTVIEMLTQGQSIS